MSPRRTHSRSDSDSPSSSRRMPGQPKSSRQQYSACGACRMRRVRCDLKDLPISGSGQHPACSNCAERGLKCVDEFAEVKAVKLLRRGRRLQQVEAVYGQSSPDDGLHAISAPQGVIPKLQPEFFSSPFFRRFQIQRPILEPADFCPRYIEYCRGNKDALQTPGQLIALLLVIWAASFGVNEYGVEEANDGPVDLRRRRDIVNDMLHEVLYLIDIHGLLRKPSWDGVRALLLTLPLTQEVQGSIERMAMHETTISHVYTLCTIAPPSSVNSGKGDYVDALVRARIFWYAYVLDGVTSALRGGRILLTDDDLTAFEATLPRLSDSGEVSASYAFTFRYATIPIRIASVCREVHASLTGPKARLHGEIDGDKLRHAWQTLDQCWRDFEGLRQFGTDGFVQMEDVERFIDGWQVFVFECHNVIRETLKQRVARPAPDLSFLPESQRAARAHSYDILRNLHGESTHRCQAVVRDVVAILRRNLGSVLFKFDAALLRDGCFFAGFLLAETGSVDDVQTCLQALRDMQWAFSKGEEREHTVRMMWDARQSQSRPATMGGFPSSPVDEVMRPSTSESAFSRRPALRALSVPPLSISLANVPGSMSAPSTACSSDGTWNSAMSVGSTDPYRSLPSTANRSPPYVPPGGLVLDSALPSKSPLSSHSYTLDGALPADADADPVFFFTPYSYAGMGPVDAQPVMAPAGHLSTYPGHFFDGPGVVFPQGVHQQGLGDLPAHGVHHAHVGDGAGEFFA